MNAIQQFGHYLLRGSFQAGIVALVCSIAPIMGIPLVGWLAVIIVGLVTLRKGPLDGFIVLLWAAIPALAYVFVGSPLFFVSQIVCGCLLVWVFSILLRNQYSWTTLIEIAAWIGIVIVLLIHGYFDNIYGWWLVKLKGFIADVNAAAGGDNQLSDIVSEARLQVIARVATGFVVSGILLNAIINLIVARWWQALMFNPGGFKREFLKIRLSYVLVVTLLVALVLAAFGNIWAWDIMPIIFIAFLVAGLSLMTDRLLMLKHAWVWLVSFYVLLVLWFFYIGAIVVVLAFIDSLFNLRKRWVIRKP